MVEVATRIANVFIVNGEEYLSADQANKSHRYARIFEFWERVGYSGMGRADACDICVDHADELKAILNEPSPFEQE